MEFVSQEGEASSGENIFIAASDGDLARVQQLIGEGTSVNAQDESGYSPLHAAASYGHTELIEFLLSAGATVDLEDADGDTPLLCAEEPEVFELLVRHGADRLKRNKQGEGIFEKLLDDENEVMMKYVIEKVPLFKFRVPTSPPRTPSPVDANLLLVAVCVDLVVATGHGGRPRHAGEDAAEHRGTHASPVLAFCLSDVVVSSLSSLNLAFDRSGGDRACGWGDGNRGGGRGGRRRGRGGGGAGGRGTPREQARRQC
jgi:hypothetical protein